LADVVQLIAQIFWTGLAMAVPTGPVPFSKHCRLERGGSADRAMPCRIADEASWGRSLSQWRTFATLIGTSDFR